LKYLELQEMNSSYFESSSDSDELPESSIITSKDSIRTESGQSHVEEVNPTDLPYKTMSPAPKDEKLIPPI
jgi:hypothetical protein